MKRFFLIFMSFSSFSQELEKHYSYDVIPGLITTDAMSANYYSRLGCSYDTKKQVFYDSTTIKVNFDGVDGRMYFEKFFNGVKYLEGTYTASDSSDISIIPVTDPSTDKVWRHDTIRVFYPKKSGTWKVYSDGKLVDQISFGAK